MKDLTDSGSRWLFFWVVAAALGAIILATRLQLSFDLSAFFPRETTLQHDILVEQLRNGPASRMMVIGIAGADIDLLAEHSEELKQALAANPLFVNVLNGEFEEDAVAIPEPVATRFLLMRDVDYSLESLRFAIRSRLRDLAFGGGAIFLQLISSDPFFVAVDVLEGLAPVETSGDLWFAKNGAAVLVAETRAAAIDIEAQDTAMMAIRSAFQQLPDADTLQLDITGVGAFSVELRTTIHAEARMRTFLATAGVLLILVIAFGNLRFLLLASLPIGIGFVGGLSLIAVLFDKVHGITLAFGVTLLGVAIDYPLHLFSHSRYDSGRSAIGRVWPTMRLGAISTAVVYLALAFSGSQGLAQLGLFTAAGVTIAALVTRTLLPMLMANRRESDRVSEDAAGAPALRNSIAAAILMVALAPIWHSIDVGIWDDNLSSLSPVPSERLKADQALRSSTSTPNLRYQLVLHNEDLETLLQQSEIADQLLSDAMGDGLLEGWQSATQLLPSGATQERRRNAIPERIQLTDMLKAAVADTLFRPDAFAPFVEIAATAKTSSPLTPDDFIDTPLNAWLESHLIQVGGQWVALVSLVAPQVEALEQRIATWDVNADLVDLQESSASLMRDYRNELIKMLLIAASLIMAILWYAYRRMTQPFWILLTVGAALAVTIAIVAIAHGGLTVIHLVALLLVFGLGMDYSLFLSRSESPQERRATDRGVIACAASTTLAFAVLAGSSIPALKFIGLTVASGSATSFLIAWAGARTAKAT